MKKKYIITGLTGLFLLTAGICYSCTNSNTASALLLPGPDSKNQATETEAGMISPASGEVPEAAQADGTAGSITNTDAKPMIYVHICGAVKNPGVYQTEEGARLIDIIALSGGLTKDAAGDYINQAEQVSDGQRYYIPASKDLTDLTESELIQGSQSNSEDTEGLPVNINTADAEGLMSLPGIGEAKAGSIISYRNKNGKFKTVEELMNIPGIKEGLFNQISSLIVAK